MKKLLLAAVLVATALLSKAQISKNQWLLGGELSWMYQKNSLNSTSYNITPTIGYFVGDKLAAGIRAGFLRGAINTSHFRVSNSIGPFVRYYFLPKEQKVNVFGDIAYLYSWEGYSKSNGYSIAAGPAFFVSPSVALEFTLAYTHAKEIKFSYSSTEISTGVGFRIHLGNARQRHTIKTGN